MQVAPRLAGGGGGTQRCRLLLHLQALPALAPHRPQQPGRLRRVRQHAVQVEQRQQQHEQQQEQHGAPSGGGAPAATVAAAAAAAGLVGARPGASASDAAAPPAEVPLPASSSMDVAVGGTASSGSGAADSGSSISSGTSPPAEGDEPELALVLLACGIGLATGAAIVGFNIGVHEIRDWIWQGQPLLSSSREVLRGIAESELWPKVVFPPFLGGLAVGALGLLIGGYDDLPPPRVGDGSSSSGAKQQGAAGSGSSGSGSGSMNGAAAASGSASALGSMSANGSAAAVAAAAPSSSLAIEQWKLQAVLRPVSRALAAVVTLGSGEWFWLVGLCTRVRCRLQVFPAGSHLLHAHACVLLAVDGLAWQSVPLACLLQHPQLPISLHPSAQSRPRCRRRIPGP